MIVNYIYRVTKSTLLKAKVLMPLGDWNGHVGADSCGL
jgi:hypothetical protein